MTVDRISIEKEYTAECHKHVKILICEIIVEWTGHTYYYLTPTRCDSIDTDGPYEPYIFMGLVIQCALILS